MAITSNTYTGNGSNKLFSITFPYLEESDVDVYLNGTLQTITTQYSFANATTIEFVTAPSNGATVRLDRSTDDSDNPATFFPGSSIKANDLNANFDQTLYVVQEINNTALKKTGDTMSGNLDMGGNRITTLGAPTTDTDAANKQYIDSRLGEIGIPGHTRWSKTATAGQTVLSGVGSEGNTLEYSASREQVFVNGALLQRNVDYTANDGLIITMLSPLILGDVVDVRCVNNLPEGIDGLASDITFLQAGTGAVSRSVDSKLKDVVSVKDFGAVGNGVADDTAAIQAAITAGSNIFFPVGTYRVTGLTVTSNKTLVGDNAIVRLVSATNAIAISVATYAQYVNISGLRLESTGTKSDGNNTTGLQFGAFTSYCNANNIRAINFSKVGIATDQSVFVGLKDLAVVNCTYGVTLAGTACTLDRAYISGCLRGLNLGCTQCDIRHPIIEYCGSSSTNNGGIHAEFGYGNTIYDFYGEANERNRYYSDTRVAEVNGVTFAATAADVISYSGVAQADRGLLQIYNNKLQTRSVQPDVTGDLVIGTNLVAPLAGGSVQWGNTTTEAIQGQAVASTWTTVKAIPATEMTGSTQQKAAYFYTIYAGYADLSTGFDFGTIYNDTLRSFSGTTPAWLRLDTQNIQVNIGSSSYGLYYKLVLHRIYPGAL